MKGTESQILLVSMVDFLAKLKNFAFTGNTLKLVFPIETLIPDMATIADLLR